MNCYEALRSLGANYTQGLYFLKKNIESGSGNQAFCDENGWTVFQSRGPFGNSIAYFYRDWNEYVKGFGDAGIRVVKV